MDEFISREATIKRIKEVYCIGCNSYNGVRCRACGTGDAIDVIEDAPAADVAPVVHAQWIEDESGIIICPECKRGYNLIAKFTNYCPACGAKMDGKEGATERRGQMLTITIKANVPAADAQGIKERIAMDIERYGDVKVVSIVSDRGREEQLRMKGAKL